MSREADSGRTSQPATPKIDPALAAEAARFLSVARETLQQKLEAHERAWQLSRCAWHVDQDLRLITFTRPDGVLATGELQIIGVHDPATTLWTWSWADASISRSLQEHARLAQRFGQKHLLHDYAADAVPASIEACWQFVAVACELGQAHGGYRCAADGVDVYVTFGLLTLRVGQPAGTGSPTPPTT